MLNADFITPARRAIIAGLGVLGFTVVAVVGGGQPLPVAHAEGTTSTYEVRSQDRPRQATGSAAKQGGDVATGRNTTVPPSFRTAYPQLAVPAPGRGVVGSTSPVVSVEKHSPAKAFDPKTAREDVSRRTEHQRVFTNSDGTQTTAFSDAALNYRDEQGRWQPVDAKVVADGSSGWRTDGNSVQASLPASLSATSGPSVTVGEDAGVSWTLLGARTSPGRARATDTKAPVTGAPEGSLGVTYPSVRPGVDLRLEAVPGGLKESLVLHGPDSPSVFDFTLGTATLSPRMRDGSVQLLDRRGQVRATMPPGFMTDSAPAGAQPAISGGVRYNLRTVSGRSVLRVTLDRKWLADPSRRWPVTVDPDVVKADPSGGVTVQDSQTIPGADHLVVGRYEGQNSAAYVAFPDVSTSLRYHRIFGATLSAVAYSAPSCSPRAVTVHGVTGAWSAGDTSLRYPGPAFGKALDSESMAYGYIGFGAQSTQCPAQATGFDLGTAGRDLVQSWVDTPTSNKGLTLRASVSDAKAWKLIAGTGSANKPVLFVTHSPYDAAYSIPNPTPNPPVLQNADGKVTVKVTNKSAMSWTTTDYYLAYTAYDAATSKVVRQDRAASLPTTVARGATVSLPATIKAMPEGKYIVDFTMMRKGGPSFVRENVPPARLLVQVFNIPPVLQEVHPANGYQSASLTPQLWGEATDVDAPKSGLTYNFTVCDTDDNGVKGTCTTSGWTSAFTWVVPAGRMVWNKTYRWKAQVKDANGAVVDGPEVSLLTDVPQPQLAASAAAGQERPYDPLTGSFTTSAVDAPVTTVGPELTVQRTYNSLDSRTSGVFGAGWSSRYDMRLVAESTGNLLVTLQDGSLVRFGKNADGTFAPPRGQNLALTLTTGVYTLRDTTGTKYAFGSTGLLTSITPQVGAATTLLYTGTQVTKITNGTSRRSLNLTWTGAHVTKVATDPVGGVALAWSYTYTGDSLTKVCGPDGKCIQYGAVPASLYRSAVSLSNPESYWRLGEAAGDATAASDTAVNLGKDNATYSNTTLGAGSSLAGTSDTSAAFNGTSSSVTLPKGVVKENRELTLELRFKLATKGVAAPLLGYQNKALTTTPTTGVPVLYVGTDGKLRGQFATGTIAPITSTGLVDDGAWHSAVLQSIGTTQTLFLDGTKVGTLAGAPVHTTLAFNQLGAASATGTWPGYGTGLKYLNGWVDEVAVYSHPLTDPEIAAHHALARTASNLVSSVTLPSGRSSGEVRYDSASARVTEYTDQNGGTWKLGRPSVAGSATDLRRTVMLADPADRASFFEYDALTNKMLRTGTPTGISVRPEDLPTSTATTSTNDPVCPTPDPGDPSFCTILIGGGDPVFVIQPIDGIAVRSFSYDPKSGRMTKVVNENGLWVDLAYDSRGNVVSQTSCRNRSTGDCSTTYTSYGSGFTDPLDPRWDRVVGQRDGRSTSATDNRYLTQTAYDTLGRLVSQTSPDGGVASTAYTNGSEIAYGGGNAPPGLPWTTTDPRSQVARMAYYSNGDLAQVTEPSGLVTRFTYDALGRKTSQTEISDTYPAGVTTSYTYDVMSRLVSETGPVTTDAVTGVQHQRRSTTTYDEDGNVTATTVEDLKGVDEARTTTFELDDRGRLARVTDPMGSETSYGYDHFGNRVWMVDANGTRHEYAYTARNMVAEERLRDGSAGTGYTVLTATAYDMAGRPVRQVDAMGRAVATIYNDDDSVRTRTLEKYTKSDGTVAPLVLEDNTYDGAGHVTQRVSAGGEDTTTMTYDAVGRVLTQVDDPSGLARTTTYTYDKNGNPLTLARSGRASNLPWPSTASTATTTYGYDASGRRTSESLTNADGSVLRSTYAYDQRGLLTAEVSPRGNVTGADAAAFTTRYANDELGRLVRTDDAARSVETGGGQPADVAPVTLAGFDTFDEVTSTKDPAGNITTSAFDKVGRVTRASQPSYTAPGSSTAVTPSASFEYDALGNTLATVDPLGERTTFEYDALNRVVARTEPRGSGDSATWRYGYTPTGEVAQVTDPTGAVVAATYDELDRQVTSSTLERRPSTATFVTRYEYSPGGRLLSTTSPTGARSTMQYDTLGQLTQSVSAAGVVLKLGYDFMGQQSRATDGSGRTTQTVFDYAGRVTSTGDLTSSGTVLRAQEYTFDAAGNMLTSTNPGGRSTTYTYDNADQLVRQVEPVTDTSSITTSFGYDVMGRQTRYTDGRGNSSTTTYNSQGTVESVVEPATASYPDPANRTWTAAYDAAGRAVKLTSPGGVTRNRVYDDAGRLTQENASGGGAVSATRAMGYDAVGRMTSVSTPRGDDTFTYDDQGDLLTAAGPSGSASFVYDEDGNLANRTDAAGTATFTYDRGRLASATDPVTGAKQGYAYNAAGDVASVDYGSGRLRSYGYDVLGRLTTDILRNSGGTTVSSVTYGYDDQDNVTSKDTVGYGGPAHNAYTYDQASRMTSWTADGTSTLYAWDASGNRTREGDKVSTYDERNRLLSDGTTTYAYTPRGTLASRTKDGAATALTFDAFDRMVTDGSLTYGYDGLDRVDSASGNLMTYAGLATDPTKAGLETYGRSADGSLLSVASGADQRLLLTDQHGDVVGGFGAADSTLGALTDTAAYGPYGDRTATKGRAYGVGYQGDWTDPTSGQVNMGARWYSPSTGSFVSRDTATYRGGDSILANKYTYAAGNPMTLTDPDGNWPSCGWCSKALNVVKSGWNTVTSAASTAYHATTSAISSGWNTMLDYGRAAWNWTKSTVVRAATTAWNAVKSAASYVYEKGKQAYHYVSNVVSKGWNTVKTVVSTGYQWAKKQAAAAAKVVYEAKVRVTAAAKAAVHFAIQHNPLPAIKAALKPIMNGIKVVTKAALALPAAVVAVTKDVVKAGAVAAQKLYEQAVNTAGAVVAEVSKAASAVSEFVQEHKAAIGGILTGIAVTAGCLAITGGAGSGACVVAGMAAGNAVMSALSCPAGRSVVGCAARGAAVGAVAGVITVASGGTATGLVVGGALSSGASTALDSALSGEQLSAGDILKSAAIGAVTAGVGAKLGPALGKLRGGCNSFAGSTKVLLASGKLKAIKDIALGDKVRATDARTGKSSARLVTNLIRHSGAHAMVLVAIVGGGTIQATDGHPFYDAGTGSFVTASQLHSGDSLRLDDGRTVRVASTSAYSEDLTAYNLTVDVDHTYYVSDGSGDNVLVHNTSACNITPGNNPSAARGTAVHNGPEWQEHLDSLGYGKGKQISDRSITDGIGTRDGVEFPVELKPDTGTGIKAGTRQLRRYMNDAGADYGELWVYRDTPDGMAFRLAATPKSPYRWNRW